MQIRVIRGGQKDTSSWGQQTPIRLNSEDPVNPVHPSCPSIQTKFEQELRGPPDSSTDACWILLFLYNEAFG